VIIQKGSFVTSEEAEYKDSLEPITKLGKWSTVWQLGSFQSNIKARLISGGQLTLPRSKKIPAITASMSCLKALAPACKVLRKSGIIQSKRCIVLF